MACTTSALPGSTELIDDTFEYTEFALNWREPLPSARFGNKRFMWGCVALSALFVTWMVCK